MNSLKYVILTSGEVPSVDFSKVKETSAETLRYSVTDGGQHTFVKFCPSCGVPDFLSGKAQYDHGNFLTILNATGGNFPSGIWYSDPEF